MEQRARAKNPPPKIPDPRSLNPAALNEILEALDANLWNEERIDAELKTLQGIPHLPGSFWDCYRRLLLFAKREINNHFATSQELTRGAWLIREAISLRKSHGACERKPPCGNHSKCSKCAFNMAVDAYEAHKPEVYSEPPYYHSCRNCGGHCPVGQCYNVPA